MVAMVERLDEVAARYDALLCDVWGVLHNGIEAFPPAAAALERARNSGKAVILVTNSPRRGQDVAVQLDALGVPRSAWDRIVSSGDVTRALIAEGPRRVFHLGPDRDMGIYEGLDVETVDDFEASAVVCTGLVDDDTETPYDYMDQLRQYRSRDLPMICANPDLVVERGDRLVYCAGALAREYSLMGGRTLIAGKPHRPIYQAALKAASDVRGQAVGAGSALAIGDGVLTDVKGAVDNGVDLFFVTGGIHAREYAGSVGPDRERLIAFLDKHGYKPVAASVRLA
jgi:HAD superfamily hydrolase (TIGR01459 family)